MYYAYSGQFSSVAQFFLTLCDPMDCIMPGLTVQHQLPEFHDLNSCPLSQWCHPTISSSVIPCSSPLQYFSASGAFQMSPSTENWIKDLLSMALPIRTRPNFPLSQYLPSGSFHKTLILLHQREDRMKTIITENYTIWSPGPQPCLTQWNYEP